MKVDIKMCYNYGAWELRFQKTFDLPFAPFYGLCLDDSNGDIENHINLETNDYCKTTIIYCLETQQFDIYIRNMWKYAVSIETLDDLIHIYNSSGWLRTDTEDIDEFKELLIINK